VLFCFFAGNDFLPHLPSLDIHEGAIGEMIRIYKEAVTQGRITGWLSSRGNCNLERCGVILQELGKLEDQIFRRRKQKEEGMANARARRERENSQVRQGACACGCVAAGGGVGGVADVGESAKRPRAVACMCALNASPVTDLVCCLTLPASPPPTVCCPPNPWGLVTAGSGRQG
jgi:hypothetical protein